MEEASTPQVAPFITVSDGHRHRGLKSGGKATRSTNETTILSFISVFSSILATLHTNLESKAIRDKVSSAKTFSGTESIFIESLDSNFRALCYDELGAFVRNGVAFPFTKELVPILQVQVNDPSRAEVSARCRCAASVFEAISGRVDCAAERIETHRHDADAIIRLLLDLCSSTESADVLIGCQSLRGLVTSVNVDRVASLRLVVNVLLERLKAETETGGVAESLVSLLYDISCIRATEHVDFPSTAIVLKTIDAGFDLCIRKYQRSKQEESEACHLLTARLVGSTLNQLDINENEETRAMLLEKLTRRLVPLADLEAYPETSRRSSMVLCDLVTHKLVSGNDDSHILDRPLGLSYHELLAKESDDIARFLSEDLERNMEAPFSAWLCRNDTLMTFRLGSLTSCYRGWLEVLIRTPTRQTRRLIRLPNSISLDSPEIPSTLWTDSSKMIDLESVPNPVAAEEEMTPHFIEPSDEMRKAASVMKKFDQMFPQSSKVSGSVGALVADKASDPSGDSNAPYENATNIEEWLHLVLKDSASAQYVVDALSELGFPWHVLSSKKSMADIDVISSSFLPIKRLAFTSRLERAISIVDRVPPFNTHKIALLFASDTYAKSMDASRQSLEDLLLSTTACSPKFLSFSEGLGKLVLTRHLKYFSGGLDTSGFDSDGKLSVVWIDRDDCFARTMAVFHVVPLMPEGANIRKRHVGNDNVHIIFVEPGSMLDKRLRRKSSNKNLTASVVSGQFGFVLIFVQTLTAQGLMKVTIRLREGLEDGIQSRLGPLVGDHIVSEAAAPAFVRQLATGADMSCRIIMQDHLGLLNWEERQSQLSAMRRHTISNKS